jgi:hypothetical protein
MNRYPEGAAHQSLGNEVRIKGPQPKIENQMLGNDCKERPQLASWQNRFQLMNLLKSHLRRSCNSRDLSSQHLLTEINQRVHGTRL